MRVNSHTNSRFSTLVYSHAALFVWQGHESLSLTLIQTRAWPVSYVYHSANIVLVWLRHECWEIFHANSRLSTLINSHVTPIHVWPEHGSWENSHTNSRLSSLMNSCSRLTKTWELRKLSYKVSVINSRQLSCNSCSRLTAWELRKLSSQLTLVHSHPLSCNSCSRLTRTWELRKL